MNPYGPSDDMFRTDANQAANSFSDPLNISHLYPGWGMNPNYQTPAYDAPYRPAYQGPNPYGAYQKQGFLSGLNQLYNPAFKDPYWGNPIQNNQNAFGAVSGRPIDLAAHVGQNYIMPTLTMLAATKMLSGLGSSAGRGIGAGIASGLGLGGIMGRAAGAIGGFAGGFALPLAGGMLAADAIDSTIFQPYIRSRQMTTTLRDSFAGITFGGEGGNVISGRGLGARQAAGMASQIDTMGIRDMTFSANQYHGIAGMSMRSGLFDDVGSEGITKRVSSIASQIKMIMAISKDPNIQTAIEELAKLRMGGASVSGGVGSQAAGAYAAIGMHASAAGASVQRVMNTVGTQGQYMFQMNGITPYLGQIAAASAFSGFASAQRSGILSTAQLARMGGLEGATQSALAAQMSGMQTPFNRMIQANTYLGGNPTSSVTGTVTAFGNMASKDPFALSGAMTLYGGHMASAQAAAEGSMGLERRAIAQLQSIGRQPGPSGRYSPNDIAAALAGIGMPPEQIQAYISMRASQTNRGVLGQQLKAYGSQETEQLHQAINQNMLGNSWIERNIARPVVSGLKSLRESLASPGQGGSETVGGFSDWLESGWNSIFRSSTIGDKAEGGIGLDMDKIRARGGKESLSNYASTNRVLTRLNTVARSGGAGAEAARKLLEGGFDGPEAKKLFAQFMKAQPDKDFAAMYEALDRSSAIFDRAAAAAKGNVLNNMAGTAADENALRGLTGQKTSLFNNLRLLGQAEDLFGSDGSRLGLDLEDTLKQAKYAELAGALGGMSTEAKVDKIKAMAMGALAGGYGKSAIVANEMGMTPDQVAADPSRFSDDPKVRAAIRAAGGDRNKITAIMQSEVARRSGGSIKGQAITPNVDASRSDLSSIFGILKSSAKAVSDAVGASSSSVDYGEFTEATKKFDESTASFQSSVAMFRDIAMGKFGGGLGAGRQKN